MLKTGLQNLASLRLYASDSAIWTGETHLGSTKERA